MSGKEKQPPDVELLRRAYRESSEKMRLGLDYLVDQAGRIVPMVELAKAVGYTPTQMRGALGAFGNRWSNRYQGPADKFPYSSWWVAEDNTMVYRMSEDVAAIIAEIRDEAA